MIRMALSAMILSSLLSGCIVGVRGEGHMGGGGYYHHHDWR